MLILTLGLSIAFMVFFKDSSLYFPFALILKVGELEFGLCLVVRNLGLFKTNRVW
jgi:hypothetical protein